MFKNLLNIKIIEHFKKIFWIFLKKKVKESFQSSFPFKCIPWVKYFIPNFMNDSGRLKFSQNQKDRFAYKRFIWIKF